MGGLGDGEACVDSPIDVPVVVGDDETEKGGAIANAPEPPAATKSDRHRPVCA